MGRVLRAPRGQIEAVFRTEIISQYTMAQRLRPYVDYCQDDWSEWLPIVDFAAACLPHESVESSPFII